jgi:hypothetical protein
VKIVRFLVSGIVFFLLTNWLKLFLYYHPTSTYSFDYWSGVFNERGHLRDAAICLVIVFALAGGVFTLLKRNYPKIKKNPLFKLLVE